MLKNFIYSILILGIVLSLSGLGCKQTTEEQPTTETLTSELLSAEPSTFDEQFNQIKTTADEAALEWKNDAKLVYLSSKIPANLNPDLVQHIFVYDSASFPNDHWTITIEVGNQSSIRALIPREDYLGSGSQQILSMYWKSNFVNALQKSYQAGGEEFVNQNPNNLKIELNLFREQNQSLKWSCEYSTLDHSTSQNYNVDAATGELTQ